MDLNGIQYLGQGLIDGYKTGLQLKRQQAEDQERAEDRAWEKQQRVLSLEDYEQRKREKAEDRTRLTQEHDEDRARLKTTQGREDDKYAREQKELVFQDNVKNVLRQAMPAYQAGQHDTVIQTLEQAYNADPAFSNGHFAQFARSADGKLVRDKAGKYAMAMVDAQGNAMGQPQAVGAEDAMLMFANQASPEKLLEQQQADKRAKSLRQEEQTTWEKRQRFTHGLNLAEQGAKTAQEKDLAQFKQTLEDQGKTREYEVNLQYELEKRKAEKGGAALSADEILKAEIDITKSILSNSIGATVEDATGKAKEAVRTLTQPPPPTIQRGIKVKASHANTPDGQAFLRIYNEAARRGDTNRANEVLARARNAGLLEQ